MKISVSLAITRCFSVWVIGGAAVLAMIISFVGKVAALIHAIPVPVMGGVSILLFGIIAASGLRMLVERKVDYTNPVNMILNICYPLLWVLAVQNLL